MIVYKVPDHPDLIVEGFPSQVLKNFPKNLLKEIAICYMKIFNQAFPEENWVFEAALSEVKKSFTYDPKRIPVVALMRDKRKSEKIIGFAWGVITDAENILAEDDLPFGLPLKKKQAGLAAFLYWLNTTGNKKVIVFKEVAVLPEYEGRKVSCLARHILEIAWANGHRSLLFWTQPHNTVFFLGLGIGWIPIYFFPAEKRVIMGGGINLSLQIIRNTMSEDSVTREAAWQGAFARAGRHYRQDGE